MAAFDVFKRIGFVLMIVLIFTPLSFLVTNTITSNMIGEYDRDCYSKPGYPIVDMDEEERIEAQELNEECQEKLNIFREQEDTYKFTIIAIINLIVIITLLVLGKKIDSLISYSLFFGAGLNTIVIVMEHTEIKSLVGVFFGVLLFIIILLSINKALKKKKK